MLFNVPLALKPSLSLFLGGQGAREENARVDMEKARREAMELYQAGEKKWGTDESKFNQILAVRSFPQLRATFDEYVKVRKVAIALGPAPLLIITCHRFLKETCSTPLNERCRVISRKA